MMVRLCSLRARSDNEGDDYEIGEIIVELDESGRAYSWNIAIGTVNWY